MPFKGTGGEKVMGSEAIRTVLLLHENLNFKPPHNPKNFLYLYQELKPKTLNYEELKNDHCRTVHFHWTAADCVLTGYSR